MILRRASLKKNVKRKSRCAWQTKDLYNFCKDHTTKIFLIMPRNKLGNRQRKELRLTAWLKVYMDFKAFRHRVGKRKEKMITRLVPQLQFPLCLQCCDTSLHAKDPPLGFWKIQHLNTPGITLTLIITVGLGRFLPSQDVLSFCLFQNFLCFPLKKS